MRLEPLKLENKSKLIDDYRNGKQKILKYFHYTEMDFNARLDHLKKRTFKRQSLMDCLLEINTKWDAPQATLDNIRRLADEEAVVVIGGQQAGLLTGPLYTINKIISIIQLAKQQEKELQVPVIPVFWIAGEDHDFDEINHVHIRKHQEQQLQKVKTKQKVFRKQSVSSIPIDKHCTEEWIDTLFDQLSETSLTKDMYDTVYQCLRDSETYVDFFAKLLFQIYSEEGLVLIDSGNALIRSIEKEYFTQLITNQQQISQGVYTAFQQLMEDDYSISLEVEPEDAHLFYHRNGERILLNRENSNQWIGKQNEVLLTTDELYQIAYETPEKLSNNVVTRPLMQDLLFPTLAFIGGPGEVGYWSVLKPAFEALNIQMPPVIPRLSFTLVEPKVEKALKKYDISIEEAITSGVSKQKEEWFRLKSDPPVEEITHKVKQQIAEIHKPIRDLAENIRSDIKDMADKNLQVLQIDIEFLEKRMIKVLKEKYAKELSEFEWLESYLYPFGGLQERVWNLLPFINQYGWDIFKELCKLDCRWEEEHYLVYL